MNAQHITLLEQYQQVSVPAQHYLARMLWKQICSRTRGKGYTLYCGRYNHQFTTLGHADGWPRDWSASYDGMLWSWFWLMQNGDTLVPGIQVRIHARGNCYCSELPTEDDKSETCDYCLYNGKVGILAKVNEHNQDGDFYGVVFPGSKPVYFWQQELQPLK